MSTLVTIYAVVASVAVIATAAFYAQAYFGEKYPRTGLGEEAFFGIVLAAMWPLALALLFADLSLKGLKSVFARSHKKLWERRDVATAQAVAEREARSWDRASVVVFGSALTSAEPGDIDVMLYAPAPSWGVQQQAETLVRQWADEWGIDRDIPIDLHCGDSIPAPWGQTPRVEVVKGAGLPFAQVNSLASALRAEAIRPGAFAAWLAQAREVSLTLGSSYIYPSHGPGNTSEPWLEGLTALRRAEKKLGRERTAELVGQLPHGKNLLSLVERGGRAYDCAAPILTIDLRSGAARVDGHPDTEEWWQKELTM